MRTHERRDKELRTNGRWTLAGLAGGGTIGIVALLMLVAPMASAAPVMMRAPYLTGHATQSNVFSAVGPGAQVAVLTPAQFSLTTGGVQGGMVLTLASSPIAPRMAVYSGVAGVHGIDYVSPSTGTHFVTVAWTVSYRADISVTPGTIALAPPQYLAHVGLFATVSVLEKSSGLVVPGSVVKVTVLDKTLTQGTFSQSAVRTSVVLFTFPLDLVSGGVYLVSTSLGITASVLGVAPAYTQSASVDLTLAPSSALSYVEVL